MRDRDRFVVLGRCGSEAHLAAQILWPVHDIAVAARGRSMPIIESRVTSLASLSSFPPSVRRGRMGSTI